MEGLLLFFVFMVGIVHTLPFNESGKGKEVRISANDPIYDDDTTTPPNPTLSLIQLIPTPMSSSKYRMIQQILRYKRALRVLATSNGNPNQNWKAKSGQFRMDANDLSNMTASELHGILGSIKHFYSASLADLCCPLG